VRQALLNQKLAIILTPLVVIRASPETAVLNQI